MGLDGGLADEELLRDLCVRVPGGDPAEHLTAIVGSIAGANLALILLDMSRARSAGERLGTQTPLYMAAACSEPSAPIGVGVR